MTRVAYVCADRGVPVFGRKGASVHVQELVRAFLRHGLEVVLLAAREGGEPPADLRPVAVVPLEEADPLAALRAADPFDLVYERYSLWSAAGMRYAYESAIPGLLEVNAPLIEEAARYRGLVDRTEAERTAREAFGAASAILAVSRPIAEWVERWREARGRVHVVPNAVNLRRFPDHGPREPRPTFTVGFLGTLKPWHGLETLLAAMALLVASEPSWRLLLVGDGPERSLLEREVLRLRLDEATTFAGSVDPSRVPRLLREMDVGVAPYPDLPGFYFSPLKILEYLAAGLPVVASRVGDLPELIRDGETGILCPPGDPTALAVALARLRASPRTRVRLGRCGRAAVSQGHSWSDVASRILTLAGTHSKAKVSGVAGG